MDPNWMFLDEKINAGTWFIQIQTHKTVQFDRHSFWCMQLTCGCFQLTWLNLCSLSHRGCLTTWVKTENTASWGYHITPWTFAYTTTTFIAFRIPKISFSLRLFVMKLVQSSYIQGIFRCEGMRGKLDSLNCNVYNLELVPQNNKVLIFLSGRRFYVFSNDNSVLWNVAQTS